MEQWKKYKLGDLFEKINKKNKNLIVKKVITNSAKEGLISQEGYFQKNIANKENIDGYYIIEKGDYVYNPRKSIEAPFGPFNRYDLEEQGVVSPLYTCLHPKKIFNSDYLLYYFKSSIWHKYIYQNGDEGARHDRVSIKDNTLLKMPIFLPNEKEQKKVVDIIKNVDEILYKINEEIFLINNKEKAISIKLYSKEFEKENLRCLGDLGYFYGGLTTKNKEDFINGNKKYITYKNVYKNIFADESECENVRINDKEKQNQVNYGDIIFTQSSETLEEVGLSSVWLYESKPYLNSFCFGYRFNSLEDIDLNYIGFLMRNAQIRRQIMFEGQGISRINLSYRKLEKLKIPLPDIDTQRKIGKVLFMLERKKAKLENKKNEFSNLKKSLMQKLLTGKVRVKI